MPGIAPWPEAAYGIVAGVCAASGRRGSFLLNAAKDLNVSPSRPVNVAALRGAMITTVFAFIWWLAGAGPIPNPFGAGIIIIGAVFALLVWHLARQRLTRATGQRRTPTGRVWDTGWSSRPKSFSLSPPS